MIATFPQIGGVGHDRPLANGRFSTFYCQQKALKIEFPAECEGE